MIGWTSTETAPANTPLQLIARTLDGQTQVAESIPRHWQIGLTVTGILVTLTLLAYHPIWDNLSMCGLPQRGALTQAFPSHLDRLWQLGWLLKQGEFELLGARFLAYSRTLPRNGMIVGMTAATWSALCWVAVRLHGRLTGRCS